MNWVSIPDRVGTWLRMILDGGVPSETQVHSIYADADGSLYVGNHWTPNSPSAGYQRTPVEQFREEGCFWQFIPTDESGVFQGSRS